jgi:hypothetical protein
MSIVRLALRRPYTYVVFSVLMLLFGIATSIESAKAIYPYIDIPIFLMPLLKQIGENRLHFGAVDYAVQDNCMLCNGFDNMARTYVLRCPSR